jgi:hypothetical protein
VLQNNNLNVKKLDLFLHVPMSKSDFAAELTQNAMGTISSPPFTKEEAAKSAIKLMDDLVASKPRLEWLTLHFTRTGLQDRAQPYLMHAAMQVRRGRKKSCNEISGKDKIKYEYEVRGRQEWGDLTSFEDELRLLEE